MYKLTLLNCKPGWTKKKLFLSREPRMLLSNTSVNAFQTGYRKLSSFVTMDESSSLWCRDQNKEIAIIRYSMISREDHVVRDLE